MRCTQSWWVVMFVALWVLPLSGCGSKETPADDAAVSDSEDSGQAEAPEADAPAGAEMPVPESAPVAPVAVAPKVTAPNDAGATDEMLQMAQAVPGNAGAAPAANTPPGMPAPGGANAMMPGGYPPPAMPIPGSAAGARAAVAPGMAGAGYPGVMPGAASPGMPPPPPGTGGAPGSVASMPGMAPPGGTGMPASPGMPGMPPPPPGTGAPGSVASMPGLAPPGSTGMPASPGMPGIMPGPPGMPGVSAMPPPPPGTSGMMASSAMPGANGMPGMPKPPGSPSSSSSGGGNSRKHATVEAAQKFLDAVKDKDLQKIQESIALRAPFESTPKHRTLFANIRDGQIDQATLDDLHEAFDEMKMAGMNTPKSTGLRGIIFTKQDKKKNKSVSRTIYVRREVAGWKVLDFSGPHIITGYATRSKKSSGRK